MAREGTAWCVDSLRCITHNALILLAFRLGINRFDPYTQIFRKKGYPYFLGTTPLNSNQKSPSFTPPFPPPPYFPKPPRYHLPTPLDTPVFSQKPPLQRQKHPFCTPVYPHPINTLKNLVSVGAPSCQHITTNSTRMRLSGYATSLLRVILRRGMWMRGAS